MIILRYEEGFFQANTNTSHDYTHTDAKSLKKASSYRNIIISLS